MASADLAARERALSLQLLKVVSTDAERRARPGVLLEYGQVLQGLDRGNEAGPQLRRALSAADQVFGRETAEAAGVALAVAQVYVATKQHRDAEPLLKRAMGALERAGDARAAEARAALEGVCVALGKPVDLPAPATPAAPAPPPRPEPKTPAGRALAARNVAPARLELAALAGDPAARDVLGGGEPFKLVIDRGGHGLVTKEQVEPDERGLLSWAALLADASPQAAVVVALAAAEVASPAWARAATGDTTHGDALAAGRLFLASGLQGVNLRPLHDACHTLACQLAKGGFKQSGRARGWSSSVSLLAACLGKDVTSNTHLMAEHAAGAAREAAHELAWDGKTRARTKARLRTAEKKVRAAIGAAVVAWALQ